MSTFEKIKGRFGGRKEGGLSVEVEVSKRTKEQMETLGKSAENFFDTLKELETIHRCKCGNMFLCRHNACPECGEPNPEHVPFMDEDQRLAEDKVYVALNKFHEVRKSL